MQPPWEQQHHAALSQKSNQFAESFLQRTLFMQNSILAFRAPGEFAEEADKQSFKPSHQQTM